MSVRVNSVISTRSLYRLPWNLADNAFSWLEPTYMCNLACDGCYRVNETGSHKSMEEIRHELDLFQQVRNAHSMTIAGGEPLLHPQIVEIVKEIKNRGFKPYLATNGLLLTNDVLRQLKEAGLASIGLHVDSMQGRGGRWKGKNEIALNELRLEYAQMIAEVGGMSCSFDATVYEHTLQYVPDLVEWAHRQVAIVQNMVFVAFRRVVPERQLQWFAGGERIDRTALPYTATSQNAQEILSTDMLARVREIFPEFTPAAFLNGSENVDSLKWLLAARIGTPRKIYGYLGPKIIELVMAYHHFAKGTYLASDSPAGSRRGRSAMLVLWPLDRGTKHALARFLKNPFNMLRRAYIQTIVFIQPVDIREDGRQSMCDGCPDMTLFNDKLVWSCRLEEMRSFGTLLRTVP
jgi:hypothetical protein